MTATTGKSSVEVGKPLRKTWSEIPAQVRAAVEQRLGSRVVESWSVNSGVSRELASRVRIEDGGLLFVKGAGRPQNAFGWDRLHSEWKANAVLPEDVPRPAAIATIETGDWFFIVFECCDPGESTACDVSDCREVWLRIRSSSTVGVRSSQFAPVLSDWSRGWRELAKTGRLAGRDFEGLSRRIDELEAMEAAWALNRSGSEWVHGDFRRDNLVLKGGSWVAVDWAWLSMGPAWVDWLTFALDYGYGAGNNPDEVFAFGYRAVGRGVPKQFLQCLAAFTGFYAWRSGEPDDGTVPGLRAFQTRQARVGLRWLMRRLS